jgi:hypothetical protein
MAIHGEVLKAGFAGPSSSVRKSTTPAASSDVAFPSFAGYRRVFAEYRMTLKVPFGSMPPSINHGSKDMEPQVKRHAGARLIAGTILVMAGAALALGNSGLFNAVELQRSWPVVLIALAIAQLAVTIRSPRQSGWGLLLLGDWLFMNTMTDWVYQQFAWPLLLAAVGSWIIAGGMTRAKRYSVNMDRHVA